MIRACLDTNVLISGIITSSGAPCDILSALKKREFILITSDKILTEIKKVLNYPKIKKNYNLAPEQIKRFLAVLSKYSFKTEGELDLMVIEDDSDDNKFLACAIEGGANFIVSGDVHLKSLRSYQGIEIITPKEFVLKLD